MGGGTVAGPVAHWLKRMNRIATFAVIAAISLLGGCTTDTRVPPAAGLVDPGYSIPAEYAEFYGVWAGKWDEHWDVTFVIDEIRDDGSVRGDYYWREFIPGHWSYRRIDGRIKGSTLQLGLIRIDLDAELDDEATAYGDFPTPRTARLTKLIPLESAGL